MKKVFVDTNVLLDLLLERVPWAQDAALLFSMADRKEVELLCCSLSFSTAVYLMQRFKYTRKEIVSKLSILKSICTITTVNGAVIDRMLQSDFEDLEDAFQPCFRGRHHRHQKNRGFRFCADSSAYTARIYQTTIKNRTHYVYHQTF